MKIYIITHYYPPEIGAPQARISEMAKIWSSLGHKVTVLTGFPNHPGGIIPKEYSKKYFMAEKDGDISIWRHWLYATPNKGLLKKTLCHISFMVSVVLLSLFRGKKPDVIIVTSPTFFSVISARIFSIIRNVPYVFEVRDLWPGIFIELNVLKNKLLIKILETIEMYLYKKAMMVVTVTRGFKENIAVRGIKKEKIEVITNGADIQKFSPEAEKLDFEKMYSIPKGKFVVLYAGAHGISHGLESVLNAANELMKKAPDVHFLFVGEGAEKEKLLKLKAGLNLSNVSFFGSIEKEMMCSLYCTCDIGLVPLKNIKGFSTFIPSKMFEIMACARPIIASLTGEAAQILNESGGAFVIEPEDVSALVSAVMTLKNDKEKLKQMGLCGYDYVKVHYDREKLAQRYIEYISERL
ncbi:MAG: hypothetical protein ACD_79C01093G0003 [uncultured bacterium]|nr:MAG: hypothetical protein ACD_79C01093G0003 [uncultured bacterium]